MKKYRNYLIIILYGLALTILLVGLNNVYGSKTDFINQHIVISQYFRQIFYQTQNLLPNFVFNLGAGQNIFNYSYYGLLSPIILISYLLPFVKMSTYIMVASVILYLASGILMYVFLKNNKFDEKISLFSALLLLSTAPLTFHFHHHIMFVWYLPFLILSLIGVDKYLNKNKSLLLIISIFLIIMTNYYYSIPSIIVILIYGVYKLLQKQTEFNLKLFIHDILAASIRIIIPVLMSCIILFPTLYVLKNSSRVDTQSLKVLELFIPNLNETFYSSFNTGLNLMFLLCPIGLLFTKKRNKSELFLSIIILISFLCPLFMYALNGMLYIRGKVLIPFVILYIYLFAKFILNMKNGNINLKYFIITSVCLIFILLLLNFNIKLGLLVIIDLIVSILSIIIFTKYKKYIYIFLPTLLFIVCISFSNNNGENYINKDLYKEINSYSINNLLDINDNSLYRVNDYNYKLTNINKFNDKNIYTTSIYSSSFNKYYHDFYHFNSGNNIIFRNILMTGGEDNALFNNFMGIKYVVSKNNIKNYKLIKRENDNKLYYNDQAFPLLYTTSNVGSYKTYKQKEFPYNLEYMLFNPVVNINENIDYQSNIKELSLNLNDEYDLDIKKDKQDYVYKLNETIKDKILIISFDMNYSDTCSNQDTTVTINGVKNKLTCKEWRYYNQNKNFKYVISNFDSLDKLKITLTKGRYKISNIKAYIINNTMKKYTSLDNIKVNQKNSTITASTDLKNNGYVITSVPYDEGLEVYIDNKKCEIEKVNTAFLGFKINKGKHIIRIKYKSPLLNYGYILSGCGLIALITLFIFEHRKNNT